MDRIESLKELRMSKTVRTPGRERRAAGREFKLSRAGRARANLAVYCDRISVLDEFVFERARDVNTDVVQFLVPFVPTTIQVSDAQYTRKHRLYKSFIPALVASSFPSS